MPTLPFLRARRTCHAPAAALALALGTGTTVAACAEHLTTPPGSLALALDPPAAAPAGLAVTLDAATLPFPASESVVRVAAAAGTPPGTYVYDVQATGAGGAVRASRTVAVTVQAAPAIATRGPVAPAQHRLGCAEPALARMM